MVLAPSRGIPFTTILIVKAMPLEGSAEISTLGAFSNLNSCFRQVIASARKSR